MCNGYHPKVQRVLRHFCLYIMFTYKTESVAINFAKFLTSSNIFPSLSPFTHHYSMPHGYSYSSFYFDSSSPYLLYYKFVILSHLIHIFHTQKGDFSLSLSLSLLIGEFLISCIFSLGWWIFVLNSTPTHKGDYSLSLSLENFFLTFGRFLILSCISTSGWWIFVLNFGLMQFGFVFKLYSFFFSFPFL